MAFHMFVILFCSPLPPQCSLGPSPLWLAPPFLCPLLLPYNVLHHLSSPPLKTCFSPIVCSLPFVPLLGFLELPLL